MDGGHATGTDGVFGVALRLDRIMELEEHSEESLLTVLAALGEFIVSIDGVYDTIGCKCKVHPTVDSKFCDFRFFEFRIFRGTSGMILIRLKSLVNHSIL